MLACVAASIALLLVAVKFWPADQKSEPLAALYSSTGQEVIEIAEIVPTRQQASRPAPPAPLPPIESIDEDLLEEVDLQLDASLDVDDPMDHQVAEAANVGETSPLPRSDSPARLVRFVPPRYTEEAKRNKVMAEIVVEVEIDERGVVRGARVVRRYLLGEEDAPKQLVNELGYGLEESALEAAQASLYRPARENGLPVRSVTEIFLSFGV
jgi:protein TonB